MIHFFTDPYEDELLYSVIGRYHYYTGNIDYKDTLEELFNKRTVIPTFEIGSNIESLTKNLSDRYTSEYIINNHTIYPFYSPFLPQRRGLEIIHDIKFEDGNGIYSKIGIIAGGICTKTGIYYCPCCVKRDLQTYGEPYIHREHQLQGVLICPKDGAKLKLYQMSKRDCSRIEYIRLNADLLDLENEKTDKDEEYYKLLKLSKDAYFLLTEKLNNVNKEKVAKAYKNLLYEKGLTTSSGRIKQRELYEEFTSFYSKQFLEKMESSIDYDDEFNWLKVATRNDKRTVHPIRHLLLINFLKGEISKFFEEINYKYNPFGKAPWPCLNRACNHYREKVVRNLKITEDYKTRLPVGTFTCDCGFVYSRKGPDRNEADKYKLGRVKEYGATWKNRLKELLKDKQYNLTQVSKLMGCDIKTVIRYGEKLEIFDTIIHKSDLVCKNDNSKKSNEDYEEKYKKDVLDFMKINKKCSRKELRDNLEKQYSWLYRHDKAWLNNNLPKSNPKNQRSNRDKNKVDWDKRDSEILELVREQVIIILETPISFRITKSSIGKAIGLLTALQKNIDKLPKTDKYLKETIETVEQFQLRRCKKIINEKIKNKESIRLWEVQRKAGIRAEAFNKISEELLNYIQTEDKDEENIYNNK